MEAMLGKATRKSARSLQISPRYAGIAGACGEGRSRRCVTSSAPAIENGFGNETAPSLASSSTYVRSSVLRARASRGSPRAILAEAVGQRVAVGETSLLHLPA